MLYVIAPLLVALVIGLMCLNFKIGFIVGDATRNTGFDFGFYMMTVCGLMAIEASAITALFSYFCT